MLIEADLHLHSFHSDGLYAPAEVMSRAAAAGLRAAALTDHDTLSGLAEAMSTAPAGLLVVPGVELSCQHAGREIHLLGYFIDPSDEVLDRRLEPLRRERHARAGRIVCRLNELGIPVTMDEVIGIAGGGDGGGGAAEGHRSIGRPHIAEAIVRHGAAADVDDAFSRYLRRGRPAFVPKDALEVREAIELIHSRGGAIAVAHPALNLSEGETEAIAREGLDAIEAWHPKQTAEQGRRLERLASRLGLVATGGSDFHGPGRTRQQIASSGIDLETLGRLRERCRALPT